MDIDYTLNITNEDLQQENISGRLRVQKLLEKTTNAYRSKKYEEAANLLSSIIKLASRFIKDEEFIRIAYYAYGRSLYHLAQYEQAKFYLAISLAHMKACHAAKPFALNIKLTETSLKKCERKLGEKINNKKRRLDFHMQ